MISNKDIAKKIDPEKWYSITEISRIFGYSHRAGFAYVINQGRIDKKYIQNYSRTPKMKKIAVKGAGVIEYLSSI